MNELMTILWRPGWRPDTFPHTPQPSADEMLRRSINDVYAAAKEIHRAIDEASTFEEAYSLRVQLKDLIAVLLHEENRAGSRCDRF